MQIKDYIQSLLDIITENPYVETKSILVEDRPPDAAYINGELTFITGSKLYFKEFVVFKSDITVFLKYAYHYVDKEGALIFRYDNALDPRAKNLQTYPEHKHVKENIVSAKRPSINEVLKEISNLIGSEK